MQIVFLGFGLLGEKLLESADRILLLPQKGQLGMAGKLLASTTGTAFEVFTVEDDGFELLSGRERLHVLEWEKEAWNPANVLGTEIFEHAKKLNLHYAHLYGDVEENSENMELEWENWTDLPDIPMSVRPIIIRYGYI